MYLRSFPRPRSSTTTPKRLLKNVEGRHTSNAKSFYEKKQKGHEMSSLNRITMMGNATRDPELRYVGNNNTAICECGLAVNRKWTDKKTGEQREEVCFVDVKAWGRMAEVMSQYLEKGRQYAVDGRLTMDKWEDKDTGKTRVKHYITLDNLILVGGRGRADNEEEQQEEQGGLDL